MAERGGGGGKGNGPAGDELGPRPFLEGVASLGYGLLNSDAGRSFPIRLAAVARPRVRRPAGASQPVARSNASAGRAAAMSQPRGSSRIRSTMTSCDVLAGRRPGPRPGRRASCRRRAGRTRGRVHRGWLSGFHDIVGGHPCFLGSWLHCPPSETVLDRYVAEAPARALCVVVVQRHELREDVVDNFAGCRGRTQGSASLTFMPRRIATRVISAPTALATLSSLSSPRELLPWVKRTSDRGT